MKMEATSIKFIKRILADSKITVKWCNCGTFQDENYKNLLEACEYYKIKITSKPDDQIKISVKYGRMNISLQSTFSSFEREVLLVIKSILVYLGDKSTINSRFGKEKINFNK